MPSKDVLRQRLGWKHPILQAPLAGGGDTPELVAAVCNANQLSKRCGPPGPSMRAALNSAREMSCG